MVQLFLFILLIINLLFLYFAAYYIIIIYIFAERSSLSLAMEVVSQALDAIIYHYVKTKYLHLCNFFFKKKEEIQFISKSLFMNLKHFITFIIFRYLTYYLPIKIIWIIFFIL